MFTVINTPIDNYTFSHKCSKWNINYYTLFHLFELQFSVFPFLRFCTNRRPRVIYSYFSCINCLCVDGYLMVRVQRFIHTKMYGEMFFFIFLLHTKMLIELTSAWTKSFARCFDDCTMNTIMIIQSAQ